MKKRRTVRVTADKLDKTFKYVSNGTIFIKNSVCQMVSNLKDGTAAFTGTSKDGAVTFYLTDIVSVMDFEIFDKDGNKVEIKVDGTKTT